MTFAEILINTTKDKPEVVNFFDYLFYAKQYCMILENIEGEGINSFSPEQLHELEIGFTNVSSTGQLTNLLISFTVSVKGRIAEKANNSLEVENLLDEMISKNLNTKVKAENPKVIEMFIDHFCSLQIGHCIRTKECPYEWKLNLTDFNNYSIYFSTQNELEDFIGKYVGIPYVIYKKIRAAIGMNSVQLAIKYLLQVFLKDQSMRFNDCFSQVIIKRSCFSQALI